MIIKNLLSYWEDIEDKLPEKIVLMADHDGTLTPIVDIPGLAALSEDIRKLLIRAKKYFCVAIISGRSLSDLKKRIKVRGIYLSGNHGFEIAGPHVKLKNRKAETVSPIIHALCGELKKRLEHIAGAIIEDKGLTASLHYRLVKHEDLNELRRIFRDVASPYLGRRMIRITLGKKVFEIRPNYDWDKGKAVVWLMNAIGKYKEVKPIYLGDDETDEDAFAAVKKKDGISILVSTNPGKSNADFFLKNVDEVKEFLEKLVSHYAGKQRPIFAQPPT